MSILDRLFGIIYRRIWRPLLGHSYYPGTLLVSILLAYYFTTFVEKDADLTLEQMGLLALGTFLVSITCFWGSRFLVGSLRSNFRLIASLGDQKDRSDKAFRSLIIAQYGPELIENILAHEEFCRQGYRTDLARHTWAHALVMLSSVISICAGLFIFYSFGSTGTSAANVAFVSALGGLLPAIVTATSLKVWLQTRANLDRTRREVDRLLKQRLRIIFFWTGRAHFGSKNDFQEEVRSADLFLQYLRFGDPHDALAPAGADATAEGDQA